MKTLSVTTEEEQLVLAVPTTLAVQTKHLVLESLPLRLLEVRVILRIGVVRAVNEAEVGLGLAARGQLRGSQHARMPQRLVRI